MYKLLEKQLPELCTTEAWKKRTHWAGLPPTAESYEAVQRAEIDLKEKRPVRRCISFSNHGFCDSGFIEFAGIILYATGYIGLNVHCFASVPISLHSGFSGEHIARDLCTGITEGFRMREPVAFW